LIGVFGLELGPLFAESYPDSIYGAESPETIFVRGGYFIGDCTFLCPLRRHATFQLAFTPDVHVVMFNVSPSFIQLPPEYGIIHGAEVPFFLGNAVNVVNDTQGRFTPEEALLSKKIMDAVGRFIYTGDPGDSVQWPIWTPELHTAIYPTGIIPEDPLPEIRTPPPGNITGFPTPSTRCDLLDYVFELSIEGKIDMKTMYKNVARKLNIWKGKH